MILTDIGSLKKLYVIYKVGKPAMPPKAKAYEASFFVIDVGTTSSGSGFTEKVTKCASNIVQRKIFAEAEARYADFF